MTKKHPCPECDGEGKVPCCDCPNCDVEIACDVCNVSGFDDAIYDTRAYKLACRDLQMHWRASWALMENGECVGRQSKAGEVRIANYRRNP